MQELRKINKNHNHNHKTTKLNLHQKRLNESINIYPRTHILNFINNVQILISKVNCPPILIECSHMDIILSQTVCLCLQRKINNAHKSATLASTPFTVKVRFSVLFLFVCFDTVSYSDASPAVCFRLLL